MILNVKDQKVAVEDKALRDLYTKGSKQLIAALQRAQGFRPRDSSAAQRLLEKAESFKREWQVKNERDWPDDDFNEHVAAAMSIVLGDNNFIKAHRRWVQHQDPAQIKAMNLALTGVAIPNKSWFEKAVATIGFRSYADSHWIGRAQRVLPLAK
jgi:hypothetical protein